MAAIYMLHITFFDVLMSCGCAHHTGSYSVTLSHSSPQTHHGSDIPGECAYRLLTKHEQSKQVQTGLPEVLVFTDSSLSSIAENISLPVQLYTFPLLGDGTYKLYRIFRSFLI